MPLEQTAAISTTRCLQAERCCSHWWRRKQLLVVLTYTARGARLTPEFFERAWRAPAPAPGAAPAPPRPASMLPALPSGDGLGNPRKARHERQGWRDVLSRVGAAPDKGLLMLVQEYCDKGSLAAAIKRGFFRIAGKNPREQVLTRRMLLRTATEICRGMIHMHKASVVHGDLKPANVLLHSSSSDRRGFVVKIADFGLARLLEKDATLVQSETSGTAPYMSPETFDGVYSKAGDVYAFGMMLWEMLTGKQPYESMIVGRILMGVTFQGLRPTWPETEWPELCALGATCLAQKASERPSFEQLEQSLVALEEGIRDNGRRESEEWQQHQHQQQQQRRSFAAEEAAADAAAANGSNGDGDGGDGAGAGPSSESSQRPPQASVAPISSAAAAKAVRSGGNGSSSPARSRHRLAVAGGAGDGGGGGDGGSDGEGDGGGGGMDIVLRPVAYTGGAGGGYAASPGQRRSLELRRAAAAAASTAAAAAAAAAATASVTGDATLSGPPAGSDAAASPPPGPPPSAAADGCVDAATAVAVVAAADPADVPGAAAAAAAAAATTSTAAAAAAAAGASAGELISPWATAAAFGARQDGIRTSPYFDEGVGI
ncbi:hypothetical protein PLESTF_001055600 [Pleodorina starrii]|nr:hypothetical protein PLESTF_001055600 [Pleodorina starrii]